MKATMDHLPQIFKINVKLNKKIMHVISVYKQVHSMIKIK